MKLENIMLNSKTSHKKANEIAKCLETGHKHILIWHLTEQPAGEIGAACRVTPLQGDLCWRLKSRVVPSTVFLPQTTTRIITSS